MLHGVSLIISLPYGRASVHGRCYSSRHRSRRRRMQATTERNETGAPEYLERVRALLGLVSGAAPEIEAARQLPPDIAEALRGAGMFAAAAPREWGGLELDPVTQAQALD